MRQRRLALVTIAALVAAPFTATPTEAAVPVRAVATADVVSSTLIRHVITDVDGDGTRDSVSLFYLGSDQFQLAVTTTKGVSSNVTFASHVDAKWAPAVETWYGASAIDGRAGSELIVNKFTTKTAESRELITLGVYTWRSGKLVAAAAPASPKGKKWVVDEMGGFDSRGYNFFTKNGHRYVDATRMTKVTWHPWKGKITRSVWRKGKWVKVSTRAAKSAKNLTVWGQGAIAGPKLLVGQVNADVDGDGTLDLVAYYRDDQGHHLLRVTTTAGKTVTVGYRSDSYSDFLGAAQLDGVAGDELIAESGDEGPVWKVLTWRGGTLTDAKMPALYNTAGNSTVWEGASDEAVTNLRFYTDGGLAYAVTGWIWYEEQPDGAVHFARSLWQGNSWVKQQQWDQTLTEAEKATFKHSGFTVDGLIAP